MGSFVLSSPQARAIVDTDVLIDFLRGHPEANDFMTSTIGELVVSVITVTELFAGVRGKQETTTLETLLEQLSPLDVTPQIARLAGQLKNKFGPSHGVGFADAVIAATSKHLGYKLYTLNLKHFPMLDDVHQAYVKN